MTARAVRTGAPRGRPVVALTAILLGWIVVRMLVWSAQPVLPELPARSDYIAGVRMPVELPGTEVGVEPDKRDDPTRAQDAPQSFAPPPALFIAPSPPPPAPLRQAPLRQASPPSTTVQMATTHQMLWLAALAQVPVPLALLRRGEQVAATAPAFPPAFSGGREQAGGKRWSTDGWLMWRRGGTPGLAGGAAPSTYGGSQLGAVARYRFAPASRNRPALYLRATAPFEGEGKEAALGLSARPLAEVPVIAAAEMRVTEAGGKARARPAAMVVTELPAFALPGKVRGEAYAQAGYVGGRNATAFVDGQLRADRSVARIGKLDLRAGGGVWGGAQKGAARLDVGPAASAAVGLGESGGARLAVDWRFRVAGDAAPKSGPALTLSAGF